MRGVWNGLAGVEIGVVQITELHAPLVGINGIPTTEVKLEIGIRPPSHSGVRLASYKQPADNMG